MKDKWVPAPSPVRTTKPRCPKCGITLEPVMLYVCGQNNCPVGLGPRATF